MPKVTCKTFFKPVLGITIYLICAGAIRMIKQNKILLENNDEVKKISTVIEIVCGVGSIFGVLLFSLGVFDVFATYLQQESEPEAAPLLNSDASTKEETQDYSSIPIIGDDNPTIIEGFGC